MRKLSHYSHPLYVLDWLFFLFFCLWFSFSFFFYRTVCCNSSFCIQMVSCGELSFYTKHWNSCKQYLLNKGFFVLWDIHNKRLNWSVSLVCFHDSVHQSGHARSKISTAFCYIFLYKWSPWGITNWDIREKTWISMSRAYSSHNALSWASGLWEERFLNFQKKPKLARDYWTKQLWLCIWTNNVYTSLAMHVYIKA